MTVKTIHYLAIALLAAAVCSCQKEPSTSDLHREYLVYTGHDANTEFAAFETFYLPDSILIIGSNKKTEYWKDDDALEIVDLVSANLTAAGFLRTAEKENAHLGIQLSYVEQETYFVGYDNPYWWWYYPYYWAPGYWGDWLGWHYPYRVYYGYTAGSLLLEMVDLTGTETTTKRLPVVWDSFISGLLTSNTGLNQQRTLDAIQQAFAQSPYLYQ
ncbi:MAG: DUF4136 domain-containing protein [Alistipes sp.]|nr:DUF4136 domain-containing protein [Alistipes sp.]MDE6374959.1 DUF4136 domain-containing protein [Alistipes sp.]